MREAYGRLRDYSALPPEKRNDDITQMLHMAYEDKTTAWKDARAAFYAESWADSDW